MGGTPLDCPGYGDLDTNSTLWSFIATIPDKHLRDIFSPEAFSSRLQDVLGGLVLEVTAVDA